VYLINGKDQRRERIFRTNTMPQEIPKLEVIVEIPRGSFLKRGSSGHLDFISPFPCPFNYGSVEKYVGLDGDLLDAVVLGPRLQRGAKVIVQALGAVRLIDRGMHDDKIICSNRPISAHQRFFILLFFNIYALCKGVLNFFRGRPGRNACMGWLEAGSAIASANPRTGASWEGPVIPY
jgi:inorganic pyrophosphatase